MKDIKADAFGMPYTVKPKKKKKIKKHPCPYQEEINDNHVNFCRCDDEQTHQCAQDI